MIIRSEIFLFGSTRIGFSPSYRSKTSSFVISGRCFSISAGSSSDTLPCSTSCIAASFPSVPLEYMHGAAVVQQSLKVAKLEFPSSTYVFFDHLIEVIKDSESA